jgi:hypothetical protein
MDDSKKKPIMIIVIVASLAIAGYVTFSGGSGGSGADTIPEGEKRWVKCNNPACKAEYEMSKRDYYKALEENPNMNPMATGPVPITCEKCGKKSLFGAEKCPTPDCGTVFIEGSGVTKPGDFADRCPKCKLSAVEERMKSRTGGN